MIFLRRARLIEDKREKIREIQEQGKNSEEKKVFNGGSSPCYWGLVLTAATSLLITISRAWAERPATRDAFDAHVNGVAHFMTAVLKRLHQVP